MVMLIAIFAGCQQQSESSQSSSSEVSAGSSDSSSQPESSEASEPGNEELEPVELIMYLIGDTPTEVDEVYGKINEILKEKINATVTPKYLSWAEHDTKYSLLFSGNEEFDIIYTASQWGHYEQTVSLGGLAPLSEEMISTYAPDIWKEWPTEAWDQVKIKGNIYMLPWNKAQARRNTLAIRGDLLTKYGYEKMDSYETLLSFYEDCAKDGMYACGEGGVNIYWLMFESLGYYALAGTPCDSQLLLYNFADLDDVDITYALEWEPFVEYCREMKKLADMGAWSSDVMNSTQERQDGFLAGRAASLIWNTGTCQIHGNTAAKNNPEWQVGLYDIASDKPFFNTSHLQNGVAINAKSKNIERSIMAINQFATNPEVQDLAQFGIEGKHWVAVGDTHYKVTDTPYNPSNYWGWTNSNIERLPANENPTEIDLQQEAIDQSYKSRSATNHILNCFTFDQEPVATQCAAVDAVKNTYLLPLMNGLVEDVDAAIAEYKSALDAAGMQDIITEAKKQVESFIAEHS